MYKSWLKSMLVSVVCLVTANALQAEEFTLQFDLQGTSSTDPLKVGLLADATDGFDDDIDLSVPPPAPSGTNRVFFSNDGMDYFQDIRQEADSKIWQLNVDKGGDEDVSLSWSAAQLNDGDELTRNLVLIDDAETISKDYS